MEDGEEGGKERRERRGEENKRRGHGQSLRGRRTARKERRLTRIGWRKWEELWGEGRSRYFWVHMHVPKQNDIASGTVNNTSKSIRLDLPK